VLLQQTVEIEKREVRFRKIEIQESPPATAKRNTQRVSPAVAPFDEQQARVYQEEWAEQLGIPAEFKNSLGMTMRLIPPGEFSMGSSAEEQQTALVAMQRNHQVP
jgi:formylglycine-generating enzyme required for sulfatase activity